jgi:hypothetical protein
MRFKVDRLGVVIIVYIDVEIVHDYSVFVRVCKSLCVSVRICSKLDYIQRLSIPHFWMFILTSGGDYLPIICILFKGSFCFEDSCCVTYCYIHCRVVAFKSL